MKKTVFYLVETNKIDKDNNVKIGSKLMRIVGEVNKDKKFTLISNKLVMNRLKKGDLVRQISETYTVEKVNGHWVTLQGVPTKVRRNMLEPMNPTYERVNFIANPFEVKTYSSQLLSEIKGMGIFSLILGRHKKLISFLAENI